MKKPTEIEFKDRFNNYYTVNNNNCFIWDKGKDKDGYAVFSYYSKFMRGHRLNFYWYYGYWPCLVLHHCGVASCVNPEHLYDGSYRDNANDKKRHGTQPLGENHKSSIFSWFQIQDIRYKGNILKQSGYSLSKEYGVYSSSIYRILKGKSRLNC